MKKLISILSGAVLLAALLPSCKGSKENSDVFPSSLTLSQTEMDLQVGESKALEATILPADAGDKSVAWSSTNPRRVGVDANGLVSAIAVGTAYVVAETVNGIKASCLVHVSSSGTDSYKVSLYNGSAEVSGTLYSWPGNTVRLEARSDDGKTHSYFWSSNSENTTVNDGLVTFGWEQREDMEGFAWYCEAVIRVTSTDGCGTYVNAVSSIGKSFRFGPSSETIGSDVTILAGKSAEISLNWFDGSAFTPLPENVEYTLKSQDTSILSVDGHTVSSSEQTVGSTILSVVLSGREFALCNVRVEKDGSKDSSGEPYTEYPVNW
ncbi:MAG: Ig domain-containing protein [Bacteroidales bacterium]|nr:Ig domain-containing protein [Bacteroidales bacterium]